MQKAVSDRQPGDGFGERWCGGNTLGPFRVGMGPHTGSGSCDIGRQHSLER